MKGRSESRSLPDVARYRKHLRCGRYLRHRLNTDRRDALYVRYTRQASACAGTGRHLSGNGQRTAYARFAHQDSGRIASVPGGLYRITVSGSDPFNRNVKLSIPAGRKNCCISQTGTIPPGYSRAPSSFSTSTIENV